ncbi:MAG: type II toxin-antitoxin system RelE/ParE family toxin [Methylococcales bacterium]|nr:type II toxin-antitoxin system RelE/ParE family toxin [Methylococcales bacterium]
MIYEYHELVMPPLLRIAICYVIKMIKSFRHKGLKKFFDSGSVAGIQPQHEKRLRMQLVALDTASTIDDMDIPGFKLHSSRAQTMTDGRFG